MTDIRKRKSGIFFFKKFLFRNNNNYNEFKNWTGSKIPKGAQRGVSYRQIISYWQICNLPEYKQTTGLQIRLDDNRKGGAG